MKTLLLLHGAIGESSQLKPLATHLSAWYNVHTLDFLGHGAMPPKHEQFRIEYFAQQLAEYIHSKQLQDVHIVGYSMGGYVALYAALHHSTSIASLCTLGTKFAWSVEQAQQEVAMIQPHKIREKVPAFAASLQKRHTALDWEEVLTRTQEMMLDLGANPRVTAEQCSACSVPMRLGVGDKDSMVSLQETITIQSAIPSAQLYVLPNTAHPIEKVRVELWAGIIRDFVQ